MAASQPRSCTPVPSCHSAYHSLSRCGTWMLTRPARTNLCRPWYMRMSHLRSGAIASFSSACASASPANKRTVFSGPSAAVGASSSTWRPFGVCRRMRWRWRNVLFPATRCTTSGNVPASTLSSVTIRCPSTCSTHRLSPDPGTQRPWRRNFGIPTFITPTPYNAHYITLCSTVFAHD